MKPRSVAPPVQTLLFFVIGLWSSGAAPAAANTAPVAAVDAVETHARQAVLIDLLANDGDADGDPLTVSITTGPTLGSLIDHGDGTVTYTPDPALFEGAGGDTFSYTVSDGRGGSMGATVTVNEIPVPSERQPVVPTVLFEDDFSTDLSSWTILDFGIFGAPSNWLISNGELAQTSNIYGNDIRVLGTYAVHSGGLAWTDYQLQVKMRSHDNDIFGVAFRYQDPDNHYRFEWYRETSSRRLVKIENGILTVLSEDNIPYRTLDDYLVEIRALGSLLEVSVDGQVVFSVVDTSFSTGTIAVTSHGNSGSYFDDIRVTPLPGTPAPVLLEDFFDDGDFEGWVVADTGKSYLPSAWQVTNGELAQTSNIFGSSFPGVAGTAAVFGGGHHWTDYRFRTKFRATDNDLVPIFFRFQDWRNHYAFFWNASWNYRSIRRVLGGEFVDLVRTSGGYSSGREYVIDLVVDGSQLEVWIDGHLTLTVEDDALLSGTVALGSEAMQGLYYDNVQVTAIP